MNVSRMYRLGCRETLLSGKRPRAELWKSGAAFPSHRRGAWRGGLCYTHLSNKSVCLERGDRFVMCRCRAPAQRQYRPPPEQQTGTKESRKSSLRLRPNLERADSHLRRRTLPQVRLMRLKGVGLHRESSSDRRRCRSDLGG